MSTSWLALRESHGCPTHDFDVTTARFESRSGSGSARDPSIGCRCLSDRGIVFGRVACHRYEAVDRSDGLEREREQGGDASPSET